VRRRGPGQSLTARRGAPRSVAEASAGTLREMNPLVRVAVRPGRAGDPPDAALLADVDVAVLTGASHALELAWDAACRGAGVAFYAAACRGSAAYLFADLREHAFTPTVQGPLDRQPGMQGGPRCVPGHAAAHRWSCASLSCRLQMVAPAAHAQTKPAPAAAQRTDRHRGQRVGSCILCGWHARLRGLTDLRQTLCCTRQDKASVEQLGAGAEASCSFPPLEAALLRPWKGLHPRRTHRLFFALSSA